ncbi:hypothetical protein B484DRAFT_255331 [Ochromonadaceae sp. CCMP2298]|nr:hypothetical protein B484DRAFT_255331 [Ochromonadaceae sp. CCMP2298]
MNRANQHALFQATNQGLISIRQSEIDYHQSLNVAFGLQAALIAGFVYNTFTQNPISEGIGLLSDFYWAISALTVALCVHVVLCTMLMQVNVYII